MLAGHYLVYGALVGGEPLPVDRIFEFAHLACPLLRLIRLLVAALVCNNPLLKRGTLQFVVLTLLFGILLSLIEVNLHDFAG